MYYHFVYNLVCIFVQIGLLCLSFYSVIRMCMWWCIHIFSSPFYCVIQIGIALQLCLETKLLRGWVCFYCSCDHWDDVDNDDCDWMRAQMWCICLLSDWYSFIRAMLCFILWRCVIIVMWNEWVPNVCANCLCLLHLCFLWKSCHQLLFCVLRLFW